ncbi:hypothetical protein QVD17_40652 [Tagetes erecta]|uniref:Uncharacterized protein n=1 Tax=Tagetes erecta TaxID=13708 RepID=A0AAD8NAX4_TARER|nr:hypothetical protein QVD17_40652 [Tagetes erecta]
MWVYIYPYLSSSTSLSHPPPVFLLGFQFTGSVSLCRFHKPTCPLILLISLHTCYQIRLQFHIQLSLIWVSLKNLACLL